ncbi:MAG: nSTAND1 domain-containing NTPase [Trebonia sp.]
MGGRTSAAEHSEIASMQASVRGWVLHAARETGRGIRSMPPGVLLAMLAASALVPVAGAMLGATAGVALAATTAVQAVGGGMLSGILTEIVRSGDDNAGPTSPEGLEKRLAAKIGQVLATGDANAQALQSEISALLGQIDAGGTALRAAIEAGDEQLRSDIVAAFEALGAQYTELGFLLNDVARAISGVQQGVDEQGASIRAVQDQNERQRTDIRLLSDQVTLALSRMAASGGASVDADGRGALWAGGCPYRGLLPFTEEHADIFYGRERVTAELTAKVAEQTTRGGLVVVTGASGAGKSSLLQAGLMRKLAEGQQVPGSRDWPRILMTPTADPLTELAGRLAALSGTPITAIRDELAKRPDQAHLTIWQAALSAAARRGVAASGDGDARLVLIVDQFEQLFTLNTGEEGKAAQQALITALCTAARNAVGPRQRAAALVIIAVRGDFFDRCADYPELANALRDGQFVVGPMTETDLRLAISGPAEAAGLSLGLGLIDTVLSDLGETGRGDAAGVLPLLSQAMALTWEKREDDRLTVRGYGEIGGVASAVETSAERAYGGLSPGRQGLARQILRDLTVAGRDGKFTRRPLARADLYASLASEARTEVDTVLEAFASQRLIVLSEDNVEISHDVLLRAWPRLKAWLEDDQASWLLYAALADDAHDWQEHGKNSSFLYRGAHLGSVQQAVARWAANPARYPAMTPAEQEFLYRSRRADTRSTRLFQGGVALLAVLAVVATIAWGYGLKQQHTANTQRDQAIFNQTAAEAQQLAATNGPLAAQLNLAAYRMQQTDDLRSRLISMENVPMPVALAGGTGPVHSVIFGRALGQGGRLVATGGFTGTVRVWDVTAPGHARLLSQPITGVAGTTINALAFSPDGQTLAVSRTAGDTSTTQLWNVGNPVRPVKQGKPLDTRGAESEALAFSSAGHLLASAGSDSLIRLWNVANPASPQAIGTPLIGTARGGVQTVAFSPDGDILASGGYDDTVRLWDVAHPDRPAALGQPSPGGTEPLDSVAFSSDGRFLASGDFDGSVRLWNVSRSAGPQPLGPQLTGGDAINSVAFSTNSPILAAAGYDGTVRLWDIANPAAPQPLGQPLTGGTGTVFWVAFSPDGRTLASGNEDGTIRLWSLPPTVLTESDGPVYSLAFSPDGRTLASGGADWTIRLWDVSNSANPQPLGRPLVVGSGTSNYAGVFSVAFSRKRHLLAAGTGAGSAGLWNVADPAHPQAMGGLLPAGDGFPVAVALSPDGLTMATSGSSDGVGTVQLWDITNPAHPTPLGLPLTAGISTDDIYSLAFSPNGNLLASGGAAEVIQLWNVADPKHVQTTYPYLVSGTSTVSQVQFSRGSRTLAAANYDGTVQLWNVADPAKAATLGGPLSTTGVQGGSPVDSVAFSPNGTLLASGNDNGVVGVWHVADPAHPQQDGEPLTGHTSFANAVAFSPDGQTLATGSNDETIRLWNLNVSAAIAHVCSQSSDDITASQWTAYISQRSYQPPCAGS